MEPRAAREVMRRWLAAGEPPCPQASGDALDLVAAAEDQGLAGLLLPLAASDPRWPLEAVDRLRTRAHWLLARGVRQLDLAARVLGVLEARGIRALPLKGAALAEALYDSPAERPMADVDVLVLGSFTDARRALLDAGYRETGRADHAAALDDPEGAGVLELHWAVTSCPGLFPVDAAVWDRAVAGGGQVPRRPGAEDLLVQLALHAAFQHGLVLSLVQWLDLRRVLERLSLDPAVLLAVARGMGAERALLSALAVAGVVVGAPWPSALPRPALRAQALDCVAPASPALARVRWAVASGRRARLVRETLAPRGPGGFTVARGVRRLATVLPHLRRSARRA
jgi:hypothetical protein